MMQKLLLLFISGCYTLGLSAQKASESTLEQLKIEIRQATYYDSTTVFDKGRKAIQLARKQGLISEIGLIYQYYGNFSYFSGNIEQAHLYYQKSILVGKEQNDKKLINSTKIRLTFIEMDTNVVGAEMHFHALLKEAKENNLIENQIEIYNGLGILNEHKLVTDKALFFYQQGLKLAEKNKKAYMTSYLLNNIGLLKLNNNQLDGAKIDFERGLALTSKINEPRVRLNLLNNLGLIYQEKKDLKSAIRYYKGMVTEAKKIGFPNGILAAYINLGANYVEDKQFTMARKYADTALTMLPLITDPTYKTAAHIMDLLIAVRTKDNLKSERCLKIVKEILAEFPDANQSLEVMHLETEFASNRGDFKMAFTLQKRIQSFSDSISAVSNQNELTKLQTIYGKERMENELDEIKNKNDLLRAENDLKTANNRFYILIGFIVILLISSLIYIQYIRKTKAVKSDFSKKLLEQIDQERSRISKDLHDDIGQSLSIVKSKINLLNAGKISHIHGMENEVGEIIEHTRLLSHELFPSGIEKIGLTHSIQSLLDKTQHATGIITSMDWKVDDAVFNIEKQTHIFRIFQECTNNTIKHSQATALKLSSNIEKDTIILRFQDNGVGFNALQDKSGIGLLTIRERVGIIGGKMEIKSQENQGFILTIRIGNP